jgi:hypothetical protein
MGATPLFDVNQSSTSDVDLLRSPAAIDRQRNTPHLGRAV